MSLYAKTALKFIDNIIEPHLDFFSDLKTDLKKSGMKKTLREYLSIAVLTCFILFMIELPLFSFIFSVLGFGALFGFFMAITTSILISGLFFFIFLNYPKILIRERERCINRILPFAGIYLSTIASSRLPPHKIFEILSKFDEYGEVSQEAKRIVTDSKAFGLNVYEAIERAVNRTPSAEFRELLWSISSTVRAGGDLSVYLSEKSKTFLNNYRRKLDEFAHSLTIYLEVYLTALVLGGIFFTVLTSIMSGLSGGTTMSVVLIQFFLIFLFIPLVSIAFVILIKASSPGGE